MNPVDLRCKRIQQLIALTDQGSFYGSCAHNLLKTRKPEQAKKERAKVTRKRARCQDAALAPRPNLFALFGCADAPENAEPVLVIEGDPLLVIPIGRPETDLPSPADNEQSGPWVNP